MEGGTNRPADCHYMETTPVAELMDMLGNTNGFKASALIGGTGGVLYSNAIDTANRQNLSKYYRQAKHLTRESGSDYCVELPASNDDDVMVILSSAKNCLVRIRIVVLLSKRSNKVLMQMYLRNLLPQIVRSLTWDPDNFLPLFLREMNCRQGVDQA